VTGALAAGLALAALAVSLSSILLVAGRFLRVEEDQRLERLVSLLPGTNCGACGRAGCRAFAMALLASEASPAGCSVSSPAAQRRIANYLQVAVGVAERRVARLACAGGRDAAPVLASYQGDRKCATAAVVAGGGKGCAWGCLGFGDCERSCSFDAIRMSPDGLPVVDEARCTACGDCVRACPKDLFRVVPEQQPLWVACNNPLAGNRLLETCQVACTACGRCVQDAPDWLRLERNLPQRVEGATGSPPRAAIERCPTGAIVWFSRGKPEFGACAKLPLSVRSRRPPAGRPLPADYRTFS
jgi:Na+-translocating ferredoxin:NAD+ oxidoreductase subunit B